MLSFDEGNKLLTSGNHNSSSSGNRTAMEIVDLYMANVNPIKIRMLVFCLALGNAADAVEILCAGFLLTEMGDSITTWDKEFLSASVFMGMLVGGVVAGYLSDAFGRKKVLMWSFALNVTAGFASALSPGINTLIFFRVVGGVGIGGSVPIVFSLGAELFPLQ